MKILFQVLDYHLKTDVDLIVNEIDGLKKEFLSYGFIIQSLVISNDEAPHSGLTYNSDFEIKNYSNVGFAQGNNVGFNYAKRNNFDYVVCLNPDVHINKFSVKAFNQLVKSPLTFDCVALSVKGIAHFATEPKNFFSILFPYVRRSKDKKTLQNDLDQIYRFHGCGFIVNCNSVEFLFDPDTFLYNEEDLKCYKSDLIVRASNQLVIDHHGSKAVKNKFGLRKYLLMFDSFLIFISKLPSTKPIKLFYTLMLPTAIFIRILRDFK